MLFIVLCITIFILGYSVVNLFKVTDSIEKIGLSVLLGCLFSTIIMMVGYQLSGRFSTATLFAGNLLVSGVLLVATKNIQTHTISKLLRNDYKRIATNIFNSLKELELFEKILLVCIATFIGFTVWQNYFMPITDWDAIALYDFRALLIDKVGTWADGKELGYFYHYPPFTSLLHGSSYLTGFTAAKLFYTFLYVGFLCVFYSLIRRKQSRQKSILGIFLVTFAPLFSEHTTIAYTNLPYTVYFSLAVLYVLEWLRIGNKYDLVLALLLTGAGSWIRQAEPFWIVILALGFVAPFFTKTKQSLHFALIGLLFFIGFHYYWPTYITSLNLPPPTNTATNDSVTTEAVPINPATIIGNGIAVVDYLLKYLVEPLILLLIALGLILAFDQEFIKDVVVKRSLVVLIIFLVMIVGGTYVFSFSYATWSQIGGSLTRMIMFLVPPLVYAITHTRLFDDLFLIGKTNADGSTPKALRRQDAKA